jgi:Recombination endonuclease VII
MTSNERAKSWREKQLRERSEEFKKYNAERAKKLYHEKPDIAQKQQANFKRRYDENPDFRAKVVFAASVGRYGWVPAQYESKLEEQDNHCALCLDTDGDAGRRLHIDHNHACCKVGPPRGRTCGKCNRGLLCGPCNRRLAQVEDILTMGTIVSEPDTWLTRALQYLDSYK